MPAMDQLIRFQPPIYRTHTVLAPQFWCHG